MRIAPLPLVVCVWTLGVGSAVALQASDTIAAWGSASADEKTKLVTDLLKRDGREGAAPRVVKCLDAASAVPGHAGLSIRTVVKACEADGSEPV